MLKRVMDILIVGLLSSAALAQTQTTWIYQHNPYYEDPNCPCYPCYGITQEYLQIAIHQGEPNEPFQFESVTWPGDPPADPNDPNAPYVGPGDINGIIADPNSGPVTIEVIGVINALHGYPYGAHNVRLLDLSAAGVAGKVGTFKLQGGLGYDGDTYVETIEGPAQVGGIQKAVHADAVTGDFDVGQVVAPLFVTTLSGHVSSAASLYMGAIDIDTLSGTFTVADPANHAGTIRGAVTIDTLSGSFFADRIDPNSPVQIQTLSGSLSVGNASNYQPYLASPVTIDTLSGTFHANMIKPDSPVLIGDLTGDGSFEVTNGFLNDPNEGWLFGSQSPVSIGSMASGTSVKIKDLRSALNLGDPNDPQAVAGTVTIIGTIADSSITIFGDHEGTLSLGGFG